MVRSLSHFERMPNFQISRKAPYEQVKEAVYEKYISSVTEAGTRLPSDRALAAEFGVNVATVAKGLSALALEGIVTRRVGSGTYVQEKRQTKQTVGVFLGAPATSYARPEMAFFAKLDQVIQQTLQAKRGNFLHYSDSRIQEYREIPLPALYDDAHEGKLSDLIVVRANPSNFEWLEKLATNVIGFAVNYGGSFVDVDLAAFSTQSVEHLVRSGCREIGFITQFPPKPSSRAPGRLSLHEAFHQAIQKQGVETRADWIKTDDFDNTLFDTEPMAPDLFGYTAFQSIWNSPQRPDGIVVHSDIVGLGVIRAAKDLRVDLNHDIKVVFSANLGSPWSPLDHHTRMAFPIKEIANTLISLIGKETPEHILVKPVLLQPQ